MEKQSLVDLFFVGPRAEVEAFVEPLKARCLLPTDKTITIDGHIERLVEYTVNGVQKYISQNMEFYEECPVCHKLEKSDNFMVVDIKRCQQVRTEGGRYFKKQERMCRSCYDAESFVVKDFFGGEHLYRSNEHTVRIIAEDNGHVWGDDRYLSSSDVTKDNVVDIVDGRFTTKNCGYRLYGVTVPVYKDGQCYQAFPSDLANWNDYFGTCLNCGKTVWAEDIRDGHCSCCRNMNIHQYHSYYSYNGGNHELQFLNSTNDSADEKMYFGVEIETTGSEANRQYVGSMSDVFHLERDGSLPADRSFEMISEPMTWNYVVENKSRFEEMFTALSSHGQSSHDATGCGFHIHVSRAAFKNKNAVNRAVAIVHGLRLEMEKFGRRTSGSYYRFYNLSDCFSKNEFAQIEQHGHCCAVNTQHSSGRDKKTVEFRFPKGTLNITTFVATICLIKNIVNAANSDSHVVTFGDLVQDECIKEYIDLRERYVQFDYDNKVSFFRYESEESFNQWVSNPNEADLMVLLSTIEELAGVDISVSQRPDEAMIAEGGAE